MRSMNVDLPVFRGPQSQTRRFFGSDLMKKMSAQARTKGKWPASLIISRQALAVMSGEFSAANPSKVSIIVSCAWLPSMKYLPAASSLRNLSMFCHNMCLDRWSASRESWYCFILIPVFSWFCINLVTSSFKRSASVLSLWITHLVLSLASLKNASASSQAITDYTSGREKLEHVVVSHSLVYFTDVAETYFVADARLVCFPGE